MDFSNLTLSFNTPFWYIILIIVIWLIINTFRSYEKSRNLIAKPKLIRFLFLLRFTALLLLTYLLISPIISYDIFFKKNPVTAFVIDNSISMDLKSEESESRFEKIKRNITKNLIGQISKDTDVEYITFSDTISTGLKNFPEKAGGLETNFDILADKILNKKNDYKNILLFTDGNFNSGKILEDINLQKSDKKYFIIQSDSTQSIFDIKIKSVKYPEIAYEKDDISISFLVENNFEKSSKGTVKLYDEKNNILYNKKITFSGKNTLQEIELAIPAKDMTKNSKEPGRKFFKLNIESSEKECITMNNHYDFSINFLKNRYQIVLLSSYADFDSRFLNKALNYREDIEITKYLILPKQNATLPKLPDEVDLVILYNFTEYGKLPQNIKELLDKSSIPQILWYSEVNLPQSIERKYSIRETNKAEGDIYFNLSPWAVTFPPIFSKKYSESPEMYWNTTAPIGKIKVLTLNNNFKPIFATREGNLPIISLYSKGNQSALLINGSGFWKIDLSKYKSDNSTLWQDFLFNITKHLIDQGKLGNFSFKSDKQIYNKNEDIELSSEIFSSNILSDDLKIECEITENDKILSKILMDKKDDNGKIFFDKKTALSEPGTYILRAKLIKNEAEIDTKNIKLVVTDYNVEYNDFSTNIANLDKIAEKTDGKILSVENLKSIVSELNTKKILERKFYEIKGWHNPFIYFAIILLLALEWYFRQKNNLP